MVFEKAAVGRQWIGPRFLRRYLLGKSGNNCYYESRAKRIRIPRDEVEAAVCKRAKEYIKKSGVLDEIIKNSRDEYLSEMPKINADIRKIRDRGRELQKTADDFATKVRALPVTNSDVFAEAMRVLVDEKKKVEVEEARLGKELRMLEDKRARISETFRRETLQKCLALVMENFDQNSCQEKQKVIQAIFPRIVLHHKENRLQLMINPLLFQSRKPGGLKVRLTKNWLRRRDSNSRPIG